MLTKGLARLTLKTSYPTIQKVASIGQELKRERELRGISLKEIADYTRINIRFLRALEEDRLDILPEKFFTRGIIRSYAKYLGLDEQSTLNTYLEGLQETEGGQAEKNEKTEEKEIPKKKNTLAISAMVLLVLIALVLVLYFVFQKEEPPPPQPSQSVESQIREEPTVTPPVTQIKTEKEQEEMTLDITVQQETWMEVYADGELQYTGIKYPRTQLEFKALKEFLIHLGNAGGISYSLNGKEGKKLGVSGAVIKDIQITLDNYQEFLLEKEETITQKEEK